MIIFTTNLGDIEIELDFERAPVSAKNFLKYCEDGFYEGTIFHRVIKGFMVQGGGMTVDWKRSLHVRLSLTKPIVVLRMSKALSPWLAPIRRTRPPANSLLILAIMIFSITPALPMTVGATPYLVQLLQVWMWLGRWRRPEPRRRWDTMMCHASLLSSRRLRLITRILVKGAY